MTKEQYIKVIKRIIESPRNNTQKIGMLEQAFELYVVENEDKVNTIKDILIEAEGIADNQEFGLSYCQAINYLEEIKDIIK